MPKETPKRFTIVGRTKATKYQAQGRDIALEPLGDNEIDHKSTATLVPIDDQPSQQVKLLETDDEEEAGRFVRDYRGDLIGLRIIDAQVNGRPGYRR